MSKAIPSGLSPIWRARRREPAGRGPGRYPKERIFLPPQDEEEDV